MGHRTDKRTKNNYSEVKFPKNPDVMQFLKDLQKPCNKGRTKREVAKGIVGNDENKIANLLDQSKPSRFGKLLKGAAEKPDK
jgi:hypothetical protein